MHEVLNSLGISGLSSVYKRPSWLRGRTLATSDKKLLAQLRLRLGELFRVRIGFFPRENYPRQGSYQTSLWSQGQNQDR
jgi:hypothetical protein